MSAISTAAYGMINASARFDRAATKTVSDAASDKDLLSDYVQQIEARSAFQANISVFKAADATTGRTLDMKV